MIAAVNLDWLEVFCLEPPSDEPLNSEFFRRRGCEVKPRDYGTPQYRECFTIYDGEHFPSIEVRRNPYSIKPKGGIFDPRACHIRLSNRQLYQPDPVNFLRAFLLKFNYQFVALSRADICCDFNTFHDGRKPQNFLAAFMSGKYLKINQSRLSANELQYLYRDGSLVRGKTVFHASDNIQSRVFNSVKWGAPTSAISTKLYDKTLELQQQKPKKYIQNMWKRVGLKNDESNHVWRVEFEIKSEIKNFVKLDTGELIYFSLTSIDTPEKLNGWFLQLAQIYFHFKAKVLTRNGTTQRKDRCPDYFPFRACEQLPTMKPVRLTQTCDPTRTDRIIMRRLKEYCESEEMKMSDKAKFATVEFMRWIANHFAEEQMEQYARDYETRSMLLGHNS